MNCEERTSNIGQQVIADRRVPMQSVQRRNAMFTGASSSEHIEPSSTYSGPVCKFFKFGACKFGDSCRFVHQRPTTSSINEGAKSNEPSVARASSSGASKPRTIPNIEEWVNAPEFVPSANRAASTSIPSGRPKSYAQAVRPEGAELAAAPIVDSEESRPQTGELCPYAEAKGECPRPQDECPYIHGEVCELCGSACLHPTDQEQRKRHTRECVQQHEKNMELSFAVARSREKSCGVCFEVILEKSSREQRFGILPNCNHCFCLSCIRKWRQAKQFDSKIVRACPECRVTSDFVCPSMYWVDTKEEKEKLITDYKGALKIKDCKYFKQGRGKCPFGNKCFYLHAFPDGTKVDVGPPTRHRRQARDGDIDFLQQFILWDFFTERDNRWLYSIDDLDDLAAFFSDSEDSDWSEYDFFFD